MKYDYPSAKCRMTTMYQGALCNVDPKSAFSSSEEVTGACHRKNGDDLGLRPQCWFLPQE